MAGGPWKTNEEGHWMYKPPVPVEEPVGDTADAKAVSTGLSASDAVKSAADVVVDTPEPTKAKK